MHPPREIPAGVQQKIKEELNNIENTDVIRKIDKPLEWVNDGYSLMMVEKPTAEFRICLDHRALNRVIKRKH